MNYKEMTADWICNLADLNTFMTITERGGMTSMETIQKKVTEFFRKQLPDCTAFIAYEPHKNGIGFHAHAAVAVPEDRIKTSTPQVKDGKQTYMRRIWKKLYKQFGRSSISPIKNEEAVAKYAQKRCLNYATKDYNAGYQIIWGDSTQGRKDMKRCQKSGVNVAYPFVRTDSSKMNLGGNCDD
jgi:hypothetical protein